MHVDVHRLLVMTAVLRWRSADCIRVLDCLIDYHIQLLLLG